MPDMHIHFDCFSGAAGDMMLAACLDSSSDREVLLETVKQQLRSFIDKEEFDISVSKVSRASIAATYVKVNSKYNHEPAPVPIHENQHHSHEHEHEHEHEHVHEHNCSHDHEYKHEHAHEHDHNIEHTHSHEHTERENNQHAHTHYHGNGPLRNLSSISKMIKNSPLSDWVKEQAIAAFTLLAYAEASVHGASSIDSVHFHEVGAIDSIVDTVGTLIALHEIISSNTGDIGNATFSCSKLPLGEGTVWTDHGLLPVPAPATLRLMQNMPVTAGPPGRTGELVTPTAAALLKVLTTMNGDDTTINNSKIPDMKIKSIGVGAGTKDFDKHPNIMRIIIGEIVQ